MTDDRTSHTPDPLLTTFAWVWFVAILIGVPSLVVSVVGLVRTSGPGTAYEIKYAAPGDRYTEGYLYINLVDGDRMVVRVRSWPRRREEVTSYPRPIRFTAQEEPQTGGAIGNFTEDDARRIFTLSKSLASGNSYVRPDDQEAIEALVDEIRREHGEDTGPAPPRPTWLRTAIAAFLTSLTVFVALAVIAATIEELLTRRFNRSSS